MEKAIIINYPITEDAGSSLSVKELTIPKAKRKITITKTFILSKFLKIFSLDCCFRRTRHTF
jgi:hypothetical protein